MNIKFDNEALIVRGLRIDQVGFHIGKPLLELANLSDEEWYEGWMTNLINYREELAANYPDGSAYTRAIRWALAAEGAVITQIRNSEDTPLHLADIFWGWINNITKFYRRIDEAYPSGCSYYEAICGTLIASRGTCDSQFVEAIADLSNSPLTMQVFGQFGDYVSTRSFYITNKGYIGIAPSNVRAGDALAIFQVGNAPYIIRQRDDGSSYEFIGETYTYGLMSGEAFDIEGAEECYFILR